MRSYIKATLVEIRHTGVVIAAERVATRPTSLAQEFRAAAGIGQTAKKATEPVTFASCVTTMLKAGISIEPHPVVELVVRATHRGRDYWVGYVDRRNGAIEYGALNRDSYRHVMRYLREVAIGESPENLAQEFRNADPLGSNIDRFILMNKGHLPNDITVYRDFS